MKRVVFYITGHGYGHAVRAVQIINALPPEVPVEVVCPLPAAFFERAIARPFTLRPATLDVGCVMADPWEVDAAATAEAVGRLLAQSQTIIHAEAERLAQTEAGAVVADSGFLPLAAAARAGRPAVLVASFTWVEIYASLADRAPALINLVPEVEAAYDHLDLHLKPPLSLAGHFGARTVKVGLIAPQGRPPGRRLIEALALKPGEKLALIYLGVYGRQSLASSDRLKGWRLVGFEENLAGASLRLLSPARFRHQDVIAQADAVIGKLGYSLLATCQAAGTPIVFPHRPRWPESPVLEAAAREWGGGLAVAAGDLLSLNLQDPLDGAAALNPPTVPPRGNHQAAAAISSLLL